MNDVANQRHTSKSDDWGTPAEIIEAARQTMGAIDLDPASSARHNQRVKAATWFGPGSRVTNGFTTSWGGKVLLNPPGGMCDLRGQRVVRRKKGRPGCEVTGECGQRPGHVHDPPAQSASKAWWFRLASEWQEGRVEQAVFVGFSIEILQTTLCTSSGRYKGFPVPLDFPLCVPPHRLAFVGPEGEPARGMTHASVIVYLPPRDMKIHHLCIVRFERAFAPLGRCR